LLLRFTQAGTHSFNEFLQVLQDVSSEEARFALYEAKKQNRYSAELQQFQVKYNQAIETIKQIAMPTQQTKQYLVNSN